MATHVRYTAFDASNLRFGSLDKNKKGGKTVLISSHEAPNKRVRLQTPTLSVPFNVNVNTVDDKVQSYTLDVSFRGYESDPAVADFLSRMRKLDDVLLNTALERGAEWFGKGTKKDTIPLFQKKVVKESENTDRNGNRYPPTMRIKIPLINGKIEAQFFDESKQEISIDDFMAMAKGSTLQMIVDLSPVWFINSNQFGVTWRLSQAKVVSRPNKLDGFAFLDDDDDLSGGQGEAEVLEAPAL